MEEADILRRIRKDIGDPAEPFKASFRGDGETSWFELPKHLINTTDFSASIVDGVTLTELTTDDYTLTAEQGILELNDVVPFDALLIAEGTSWSLYTDEELMEFVEDAVLQHTSNRSITERYKDNHGHIKYRETPMTLENLPPIEDSMVALLAVIEILWSLSTDASTDIDVITAEGTHIPRSQRYQQLREQIDLLTQKYHDVTAQLNIGLFRVEQMTLRRVSRTTGRLVPVFKEREYDDTSRPARLLPEIDSRDEDTSGIPSPLWPFIPGP